MIKVAIDAMGGDFGPKPIVEGVIKALQERKFEPILVGNEEELKTLLPQNYHSQVRFINSSDVISMEESATDVFKRKETSIYKAVEAVRENQADAVVSAGHSGATMSLATLRIGRIKGIKRPAIATLMPTSKQGYTLVLDVGANVDCDSENLYQFALMGESYSRKVQQVENPTIGLLSNGEESSKGNIVTKETFKLLKEKENFIGNVEGNDIFFGTANVVVCDGFTGNILLKASEGAAKAITTIIKKEVKDSVILSKIGAFLMKSVFKSLKKSIDYAEYGGAPLLGVNGCVIISHGKSNPKAIKNAIFQAIDYAESNITDEIAQKIKG